MDTERYESVLMPGKSLIKRNACTADSSPPYSLWVFHAKSVPQSGLNPFIRTLFFKILKLLQYPVLLLFVFDGPHKPTMKRGNKVGGRFGRGDRESLQFKLLLDEMGLEYWDVSVVSSLSIQALMTLDRLPEKQKRNSRRSIQWD